ncbi:hypothetical protein LX36DRAFT_713457 [Colletotrichum falcatum]|nr:hypothetical protein LX36DRAFT_713457 [Colletotrichum falcatum]
MSGTARFVSRLEYSLFGYIRLQVRSEREAAHRPLTRLLHGTKTRRSQRSLKTARSIARANWQENTPAGASSQTDAGRPLPAPSGVGVDTRPPKYLGDDDVVEVTISKLGGVKNNTVCE